MKIIIGSLKNAGEAVRLGDDKEFSFYKVIECRCGKELRAWDFDLRGLFKNLKCSGCGEDMEFYDDTGREQAGRQLS
mgnify:CR=1 FL=1